MPISVSSITVYASAYYKLLFFGFLLSLNNKRKSDLRTEKERNYQRYINYMRAHKSHGGNAASGWGER